MVNDHYLKMHAEHLENLLILLTTLFVQIVTITTIIINRVYSQYHNKALFNESTTGADASVEVPKLYNIKLLIASFYTHIDIFNFAACRV